MFTSLLIYSSFHCWPPFLFFRRKNSLESAQTNTCSNSFIGTNTARNIYPSHWKWHNYQIISNNFDWFDLITLEYNDTIMFAYSMAPQTESLQNSKRFQRKGPSRQITQLSCCEATSFRHSRRIGSSWTAAGDCGPHQFARWLSSHSVYGKSRYHKTSVASHFKNETSRTSLYITRSCLLGLQ